MRSNIPRLELFFYSMVWLTNFIYSFYKVYYGGRILQLTYFEPEYFSPALFPVLEDRDSSDYEWELWTGFLAKLSPWIVLHLVVCETVRAYDTTAIPLCHVGITVGALMFNFSPVSTFLLIITLIFFLCALLVKSKFLTWFFAISILLAINLFSKYFIHAYRSKYDEITLSILCFEWFLLKCIDFTLIEIRSNRSFVLKFMDLLGYAFYLPCFFLGPFLSYDNFKAGMYRQYQPLKFQRIKMIVIGLLRALSWYWVFEICTHLFYCHAMHYKVAHVVSLGTWTLHGVGLCMAQFFFIKYTVIYGGALSIARFELYDTPPNPKCVNRIHLYSNMWRHFDRGFYMFLLRCIYKPICKTKKVSLWKKLIASFYCFWFVFLWHGINRTILIWSTMNFLGICFESVGKSFVKTKLFKRLENILGRPNMRRAEAIVCSPVWVMAVISNYIFFGDYELGMAYINQIVTAQWSVIIFALSVGYCMCQLCIEVINWECRRDTLHFKH